MSDGTRTAMELALAELGEDEDEQLALFGAALTEGGIERQSYRGRGRPPGSRNKRTERTVAWLLSRHRDPRQVLLEIAEANVDDLVVLLGCTPLAALQEKRLAATAVLPFIAQKQPLAVNVSGRQVVYLSIGEGAPVDFGDSLTGTILENVTFQEVSDGEPADV